MKILHINTERTWRGGEQQTLNLLCGLQERKIASHLTCQPNSPMAHKAGEAGLRVIPLDMHGEIDLMAAGRIRSHIRKNKYDLMHAHFIFPTGITAYLLKRIVDIPLIITAHGSDVPGYNPDRFNIMHRLLRIIWKKIVRGADAVTSPSEFLKKLIRDNCEKDIEVIPNGFEAGSVTCPSVSPSIRI